MIRRLRDAWDAWRANVAWRKELRFAADGMYEAADNIADPARRERWLGIADHLDNLSQKIEL